MEIEFARTFLAVTAAGNFIGAAERLHITQSTVSARIQALETQLGARLFRRGRGGAQLTPAGSRFLRHAKAMVRTFEQARHDVGLPEGFRGSLTLSGRIALWEGFLPRWAQWMRCTVPDVSLRMEIGFEEGIMQGLVAGTVDIGVMYTPESRPGLGGPGVGGLVSACDDNASAPIDSPSHALDTPPVWTRTDWLCHDTAQ